MVEACITISNDSDAIFQLKAGKNSAIDMVLALHSVAVAVTFLFLFHLLGATCLQHVLDL